MSELYHAETIKQKDVSVTLLGKTVHGCRTFIDVIRDFEKNNITVERRIYAVTPCGEYWGKVVNANDEEPSTFELLIPSCGDIQKRAPLTIPSVRLNGDTDGDR